MRKSTFNVALCGVISAISVVVMMLTAVVPVATYATPALAGMILVVLVIETNCKWAFASYIAVSIVSLLIVPDKEAVSLYVLFFGYYSMLKQFIESHIKNRMIQLGIKILVFSVAAISIYFISINLLGIPAEEYQIMGINIPVVFLVLGIIVFLLFDYAFTGIISTYIDKFRDKIFKNLKVK
ncbi:MAG: hypothetical protein UH239_08495 [Acutalibacteraceae bacterium]|nr:hypothetical protein [Acutalibacteraceae bacterium]